MFIPQDFLSMFGLFSTLCMEGLSNLLFSENCCVLMRILTLVDVSGVSRGLFGHTVFRAVRVERKLGCWSGSLGYEGKASWKKFPIYI